MMSQSPLKIRRLRVRAVTVPMSEPHRTASGTITESPLVLTDVITDQDIVGHSYVFCYSALALKPTALLIAGLEPLIAGRDVAGRWRDRVARVDRPERIEVHQHLVGGHQGDDVRAGLPDDERLAGVQRVVRGHQLQAGRVQRARLVAVQGVALGVVDRPARVGRRARQPAQPEDLPGTERDRVQVDIPAGAEGARARHRR